MSQYGKMGTSMTMTDSQKLPAPPRLIPVLVEGFDAITDHILIILFPIALDLLIWFAPHLRLKNIIEGLLAEIALFPSESAEFSGMLETGQGVWLQLAEQINLAVALRSYPVGIPSLMTSALPIDTPFGEPWLLEVSSLGYAFLIGVVLMGIGLVVGTLYYLVVVQAALKRQLDWSRILSDWPRASLRVILLALVWFMLFFAVSIPASCLISVITLAGFSLGQLSVLLYGGFLIWLIFPLLFSAHGIFVKQLGMWPSIRRGVRITNLTLPTTLLFFATVLLLTQGLDILWRIPPPDSWLSLLGVAGHAFIATGLLSASFVYYRDADRWVTSMIKQSQSSSKQNS
jgi:hypothetical protein